MYVCLRVLRRNDIQYVAGVCIYHPRPHDSDRLQCIIQLDRLVKEFIVPLEKQISSEQELLVFFLIASVELRRPR